MGRILKPTMAAASAVRLLLISSSLALAGAATPNPSNPQLPYRCEKPSPSFCTNVDWMVSNNSLSENSQNMAKVVLEIAYYSQPGTDDCKKQYKDIECRRRFPYCDGGPVTRRSTSARRLASACLARV